MKFPLNSSCTLQDLTLSQDSRKAQPFESSSPESQLLKFHPLGPIISCSQHYRLPHMDAQIMQPSDTAWLVWHLAVARTSLQKVIRSVKHNFPFVNPC